MKISNKVAKFQEGGAMPVEAAAAPQEQGNPMEQILQAAAQAVQANDPQMALQVCQALVQLAQQAQGGAQPQEAPAYQRKGGKLVRKR